MTEDYLLSLFMQLYTNIPIEDVRAMDILTKNILNKKIEAGNNFIEKGQNS